MTVWPSSYPIPSPPPSPGMASYGSNRVDRPSRLIVCLFLDLAPCHACCGTARLRPPPTGSLKEESHDRFPWAVKEEGEEATAAVAVTSKSSQSQVLLCSRSFVATRDPASPMFPMLPRVFFAFFFFAGEISGEVCGWLMGDGLVVLSSEPPPVCPLSPLQVCRL